MSHKNKNILHIRHLLEISSTELGKRIGVSRQTINNIESGRTICTKPMFKLIKVELKKDIKKCQDNKIKSICENLLNEWIESIEI